MASQKKKTSKQKLKTNLDFQKLFHSFGQGVIIVDEKGKILKINNFGKKVLGYNQNGIHGEDWMKVLKPERVKEYDFVEEAKKTHLKTSIKRKLTTKFFSLLKKDGRRFPALITLSPVKTDFVGGIISFIDNSRDHQIMQSKNELISLAAHQMRTPLTTLRWYLEMLSDGSVGKVDKEAASYLQEATSVNEEMMGLIESLLNISRFELGTFVVNPTSIDVCDSAKFIVKELQPQVKEKNIKLNYSCPSVSREIEVDKRLLEIIIQNLASNAVKYTPDGGKIDLNLGFLEKGKMFNEFKLSKESLVIEVSDNGVGIPKKDQEKIFTRLFRAENVLVNGFEGTGLGLYIVKSIVKHFGGQISFRSKENKGTKFYVYLPLANLKKKSKNKNG